MANSKDEKCYDERLYGNRLKAIVDAFHKDFAPTEARRASPLILTAYCGPGSCYALIEPFITLDDFAELISGPRRLVHVGLHNSMKPPRIIHVVSVYEIATRPSLGSHGCPADPGGVARPGMPVQPHGGRPASHVVREVSVAALEWIKALLK